MTSGGRDLGGVSDLTCELGHVLLRDPHDPVTGLDLLRHQRFGGSHEDDLARGEPAVVVVHEDGGDEGLAQAGGQTDQRVPQQRRLADLQLVLPDGVVGGVDPDPARRGVESRLGTGLQRALGLEHGHQHDVIIIFIISFIMLRSCCGLTPQTPAVRLLGGAHGGFGAFSLIRGSFASV